MSDYVFDLGSLLRTIRKKNAMSLREVSRRSNYSHSYISSVENGVKIAPSDDFIISYLDSVCSSNSEVINKVIDLINDNTLMELKHVEELTTQDQSINLNESLFVHGGNTDNNNEKPSSIKTILFEENINDIYFHLHDSKNEKYYEGLILSELDKFNIECMVQNYFEMKKRILEDE